MDMDTSDVIFGSSDDEDAHNFDVDVAKTYWSRRQYTHCLQALGKSSSSAANTSDCTGGLLNESNTVACRLLLQNSQGKISELMNKVVSLQDQIRGQPCSEISVILDVILTFNLISIIMKQHMCVPQLPSVNQTLVSEIENKIVPCLSDICEYLGCERYGIEGQKNLNSMCNEILNYIKSKLSTAPLHITTMLLSHIGMIYNFFNGSTSSGAFIYDNFKDLFPQERYFLPNTAKPSSTDLQIIINDGSESCEFASKMLNMSDNRLGAFLYKLHVISQFCSGDYVSVLELITKHDADSIDEDFAYMKAFILWTQGRMKDCLALCSNMKDKTLSHETRRWHNILAACVDKQGKSHIAIQLLNGAMQESGTTLLPLYNMSLLYRKLRIFKAEVECLELLCRSLEEEKVKDIDANSMQTHFILCDNIVLPQRVSETDVCLAHSLYVIAKRHLELGQYDSALVRYKSLIELLRSSKVYLKSYERSTIQVSLPPVRVILTETAYSMMQTGLFTECISLCDELLSALGSDQCLLSQVRISNMKICANDSIVTQSVTQVTPPNPSSMFETSYFLSQDENAGQKRSYSQSNPPQCVQEAEQHLSVLMMKSNALANLGKYTHSLSYLTDVIEMCQQFLCQKPTAPHPSKVRKVDPGNEKHTEVLLDEDDIENPITIVLKDALLNKANLLVIMNKLPDAVNMTRLAIQLDPTCDVAWYNHALILLHADRWKEACHAWLPRRHITPDPYTLEASLKTAQLKIEACEKSETCDVSCFDALEEKEKLTLDLHLLLILKEKTKRK